ncbi:FAD-dependent oxidoreductase [Paenibacillus thermoaerophilus]|uniref:FAD-dependent oxidoreductase n=1 Tax=Paenibacillus thermoaerophilus TaxID=1215385 RepID=A0ABW2V143_9BACL|nr:FAD-binding oxidoreductase [Paenibacillus thermoaerophilus]
MRLKKAVAVLLLVALAVVTYAYTNSPDQDPYRITDYSRLRPVKVERVVAGREEEQLAAIVREARERGIPVSVAGQRHSQGGHTYYRDGIVVDMTTYNRVLEVDPERRTIRVQAGATWEDVQEAINPYGLSVKQMQSQNIFTVGGSVSINAHGRDIRNGSLIKSVESFRLLTPDGGILNVSRTENADWFPLALGGYGLFGIILDVTLSLTDDEVYRMRTEEFPVEDYERYFREEVLGNPDVRMHIARVSVSPEQLLTRMYAVNYELARDLRLEDYRRLRRGESGVAPAKAMFALNRMYGWGKNVFWRMQSKLYAHQDGTAISRNNAMRGATAFMEYQVPGRNDLLQEYFIPLNKFDEFINSLREILKEEEILNLLNITVRYVHQDTEAVLSYAREEMFALVCLFHVPLTGRGQEEMRRAIRRVVDESLRQGGTYYLPYAPYPSIAQFRAAYPEQARFFAEKDRRDPGLVFRNYFYDDYRGE